MSKRFEWHINTPRTRHTAALIVGSFVLAFLLCLLLPGTFSIRNNQVMDRFIRIRYHLTGKQEVSPYLVHVVLNDSSYEVLDLASWDRTVFGRVIQLLLETDVNLIACDVFFKDPATPENDRPLLDAVAQAGNTVLPILVYPEDYFPYKNPDTREEIEGDAVEAHILRPVVGQPGRPPTGRYVIPPFRELSDRVLGLGHINYTPDIDGMCRRVALLYRYKNGYIPAFSLKIMLEYFGVPEENIQVDFGRHITLRDARIREDYYKDVVIPIDRQGRIIVNFTAPWDDSFLSFPVHKLLEAAEEADSRSHLFDLMDGALVVISDTSTTNRDYGPGIFETVYPLSGVHVNIVNSILTESFLADQPLAMTILIALVFAALLWLLALRVRRLSFTAGSFLLYGLFLGFSFIQFIIFRQVPRMIAPSLGFLVALFSVNVYRIFVSEKEKSVYKVKSEAGQKLERLNRELVSQKRNLEEANRKLAVMDRFKTKFVQNIAHEFRTPLTLIIDPLESILNHGSGGSPDFVAKNLVFVRKNARKLLGLVNQFLDLSKFEAGKARLKVSRSDMVDFLRSFVARFEPIAERKQIQLRFSSSVDSLDSYFDVDKLDKIFTNLLSNSLKASEAEDLIEIHIQAPKNGSKAAGKSKNGQLSDDEMIRITVRDTGSGIPANDLPFIFERFHQVEHPSSGSVGGSGVGLSLVKECVELHHGHINVESKLGRGTQFTLYLPWAREQFAAEEISELETSKQTYSPGAKHADELAFLPEGLGPKVGSETRESPITDSGNGSGNGSVDAEPLRTVAGKYPGDPILIVDDEVDLLENYRIQLGEIGIDNLVLCSEGVEVLPTLHKQEISGVLLDLSLPGIEGTKLLKEIRENYPGVPVLVITGLQDVDTAVECIKLGAVDYMVKPVEPSRLLSKIHYCIDKRNLEKQINILTQKIQSTELKNPEAFADIVTRDQSMLSKFRYVEAIAESSNPVLITGESGVGKELVAQAIHRLSKRTGKFVSENIAGLDDTMISDALFGHAKGAFTDAESIRKGLVEEAAGGTLFLDEIGDMSINSQVKLLRFIELNEYRPLGADKVKVADARIIIATNANLSEKLETGTFRKDLFYRLTHQIRIPPLRERLDDLPILLDHFVARCADELHRSPPKVTEELILLLRSYEFPGNIRELRNIIENAMSRSSAKTLSLSYFKEYLRGIPGVGNTSEAKLEVLDNHISLTGRFPKIEEIEEYVVAEALRRSKGKQNVAARLLGLSPSALSRRIKKMGGKKR
jgi:DNA-binding NtrC family response regulator/signal transduction histidine kinase